MSQKSHPNWIRLGFYLVSVTFILTMASAAVIPCKRCNSRGKVKNKMGFAVIEETCNICHGKGKVDSSVILCPRCSGTAKVNVKMGFAVTEERCNICHGHGTVKPDFNLCPRCSGSGKIKEKMGFAVVDATCNVCHGNGGIEKGLTLCPTCIGQGHVNKQAGFTTAQESCSRCNGHGVIKTDVTYSQDILLQDVNAQDFKMVEDFVSKSQKSKVLTLLSVAKVVNPTLKSKYKGSGNEKWLFHGSRLKSCIAISQGGYKLPDHPGMLGVGVYFALDPNKSIQYCPDGKRTMLLNQVNLDGATFAQNKVFGEYMIRDPEKALPLYMLTFK